ncbi:S-layer homology domain-containing protein [Acetivibrio clariflavus]|uniref:Putative S-layer protein n=1 Tax=Acetivibrio clariflavus (strain DSM 19732 / NBRC 101661 / EBR45) TaxID=720554 RepID=G8LXB5_ACECE|nr:S-layer homology domain-containing protein [Acetivibrio clariflavus]AEV69833.1 putative S-layer protein [Acetivibrio clariflavus DSM 19732]
MGIKDRLFSFRKVWCIVIVTVLTVCYLFTSFTYADDSMQVNLAVLRGEKGTTVTVPLTVKNVPESGIYTCSFWVDFNPEIFSSVSITPGELIINPSDFYSNVNNTKGFVAMVFEAPADESRVIKNDGTMAYIKFTIADNASDGVSFLTYNLSRSAVFTTGIDEIKGILYNNGAVVIGKAAIPSVIPTSTPTVTPTPTSIITPTSIPTPTSNFTPTLTPTPFSTPTVTSTPIPTSTEFPVIPTLPPEQVTPISTPPTGNIQVPKDIDTHWAKLYILRLISMGVVQGYPDGTIKPDNNITRAEAITALMKAIGYGPAENPQFDFADKNEIPDWVKGFLKTALDMKVVSGYEDNTFRASRNVTRQEVVIMLMKTFKFEPSDISVNSFADDEKIASWSKRYVNTACNLGIIKGYNDNTFMPDKNVTRAELFTMIAKCFEYLDR